MQLDVLALWHQDGEIGVRLEARARASDLHALMVAKRAALVMITKRAIVVHAQAGAIGALAAAVHDAVRRVHDAKCVAPAQLAALDPQALRVAAATRDVDSDRRAGAALHAQTSGEVVDGDA